MDGVSGAGAQVRGVIMSTYRQAPSRPQEDPTEIEDFAQRLRAPSRRQRTRGIIAWTLFLAGDVTFLVIEGLTFENVFFTALAACLLAKFVLGRTNEPRPRHQARGG